MAIFGRRKKDIVQARLEVAKARVHAGRALGSLDWGESVGLDTFLPTSQKNDWQETIQVDEPVATEEDVLKAALDDFLALQEQRENDDEYRVA
jgi:hypothetical protein